MRILFVTPYPPAPPDFGGAIRMYHLVREVARVHDVRILSLAGLSDDLSLTERELAPTVAVRVPWTGRERPSRAKRWWQLRSLVSPHSAQYRQMVQPSLQAALERLLRSEPFDLLQFEFSLTGLYRPSLPLPTVLDVHNIEHELVRQVAARGSLVRRCFNAVEWRKLRREELRAWRRASVCLATSVLDARLVAAAGARQVVVVPNGVDPARVRRTPVSAGRPEHLLFVGSLRYWPNVEGVRFFVQRVLPLLRQRVPSLEFVVVGSDPLPEVWKLARRPGVRLVGPVPDPNPWLERCGIVVVPLFTGSGTRLKVLEAFAAGRPVVATTMGAAGLAARDGVHLLLADTPEEMAAAVVRLVESPQLREDLVTNARNLVEQCYRWNVIGQRLLETYERLEAAGRSTKGVVLV
jgi:glycosyltransferase involved in cell wall biosynthesis